MINTIEYALGSDVPEDDYGLLAKILNDGWGDINQTNGDFFSTTPEMLKSRFQKDSLFLVQYDVPTEEEKDLILLPNDKIPIALLETIGINANSYDDVPKLYTSLVGEGNWRQEPENPDTLILVDVTLLNLRRGSKNGEGNQMIQYALQYLGKHTDYEKVWTFTPDINGVKKWHMKNGAIDTGYVIENARPNFSFPNVNLMDYSNRVVTLRI